MTKAKGKKNQELSQPSKKEETKKQQTNESGVPDPETFNGQELTMTQLYDIIKNIAQQTHEKNQEAVIKEIKNQAITEIEANIKKLKDENEMMKKTIEELGISDARTVEYVK